MNSKVISISAIAAAVSGLLVGLGCYFGNFDFSLFLLAGIFLTIPLYRNSVWGCVLAYLAGGFIGLMISGFNIIIIFPYFVWFGIHPVLGCVLARKGVKKWLSFLIKLVFLELTVFLLLQFTQALTVKIDFLNENAWVFYLVAAPILWFYDRMVEFVVRYLFTVLSKVAK